ncbi:hypothetical protein B0H13DRAFT_1923801 [Mycena leptocephala]|nr:hypothetical protein B0H13DRAFT_1923801 [Mycena leptocephala]
MIEGLLGIGFGQIPDLSPQCRCANVAVGRCGTADELGRIFRGWCEKLGIEGYSCIAPQSAPRTIPHRLALSTALQAIGASLGAACTASRNDMALLLSALGVIDYILEINLLNLDSSSFFTGRSESWAVSEDCSVASSSTNQEIQGTNTYIGFENISEGVDDTKVSVKDRAIEKGLQKVGRLIRVSIFVFDVGMNKKEELLYTTIAGQVQGDKHNLGNKGAARSTVKALQYQFPLPLQAQFLPLRFEVAINEVLDGNGDKEALVSHEFFAWTMGFMRALSLADGDFEESRISESDISSSTCIRAVMRALSVVDDFEDLGTPDLPNLDIVCGDLSEDGCMWAATGSVKWQFQIRGRRKGRGFDRVVAKRSKEKRSRYLAVLYREGIKGNSIHSLEQHPRLNPSECTGRKTTPGCGAVLMSNMVLRNRRDIICATRRSDIERWGSRNEGRIKEEEVKWVIVNWKQADEFVSMSGPWIMEVPVHGRGAAPRRGLPPSLASDSLNTISDLKTVGLYQLSTQTQMVEAGEGKRKVDEASALYADLLLNRVIKHELHFSSESDGNIKRRTEMAADIVETSYIGCTRIIAPVFRLGDRCRGGFAHSKLDPSPSREARRIKGAASKNAHGHRRKQTNPSLPPQRLPLALLGLGTNTSSSTLVLRPSSASPSPGRAHPFYMHFTTTSIHEWEQEHEHQHEHHPRNGYRTSTNTR